MSFWKTEKINLQSIEPEDWKILFKWNADGDMSRHIDFLWPPTSQEHTKEFAAKTALQKLEGDAFHWIIEDSSGTPVRLHADGKGICGREALQSIRACLERGRLTLRCKGCRTPSAPLSGITLAGR